MPRSARFVRSLLRTIGIAGFVCAACPTAGAGEVVVAVATNFLPVLERIAPGFEAASGHTLRLVSGSTGKLYAQIVNGAPFDVFLSADDVRPARLVSDGRAMAASRRTYALGRLVLWCPSGRVAGSDGRQWLRDGDYRRLAIANPELAPYGRAAREVLARLGLEERLADRIVMGENIGQAYALVATGNAELGFVAASQVRDRPPEPSGAARFRIWIVPEALHAPIRQDLVLLARSADQPAARAFLDHLLTPEARDLIRSSGYDVN